MNNNLIFRYQGQNFIAFSRNNEKNPLQYFPVTTWKKKLINLYLRIVNYTGIKLPFVEKDNQILLFQEVLLSDLLVKFYQLTGLKTEDFFIMWNREHKRKRVYIWCLNHNVNYNSFIKVSYGNKNDLEREWETLNHIGKIKTGFQYPKAIAFFQFHKLTVLATTLLPKTDSHFHYLPWEMIEPHFKVLIESTSRSIQSKEIYKLNWFVKLKCIISFESYQIIRETIKGKRIQISRVHGDLGSENVFLVDGQIWLIDWEMSSENGPILTDQVAHWIGRNNSIFKNNYEKLFTEFSSVYLTNNYQYTDVLLAICYLVAGEFPPATELLKHLLKKK